MFLVCLTPRCSCHAGVRTNLVIRRCRYGPGILGVSNHAFRAWIEAQPNLMRCNPERRNAREAGWLGESWLFFQSVAPQALGPPARKSERRREA